MAQSTPPLEAEIATLKEVYAALNRNDIPAMLQAFDPQIERIEPSDVPSGGIYHGLAALEDHIVKARETWAEGTCEPERFIVAGDKIIVVTHVHVRLKKETEWREGATADVFTFRNGKVIEFRTFFERQQAFDWVGVKA